MFFIITQRQSEYWGREFKAEVISDGEKILERISEIISLGYSPIVGLTELNEELESLPHNSLIALLDADEKYDSKLNSTILNSKVFKAVIRQYKVSNTSQYEIFKAFIVGIIESFKILSFDTPRRTVGWYIEGLGMAKRQDRLRKQIDHSEKIIINIPLGYTDFFAETFLEFLKSKENLEVSKSKSLLEIALQRSFVPKNKNYKFVFIGQLGQIVRQHAIEALQKLNSKKLVVRKSYGGVSNDENRKLRIGEEYVGGLMESEVSVCPPGNISGNSYRIMESLICGAYPAVMSHVLCDPQFESPVIEVLQERKPRMWYRYLKKLEKVPQVELQEKILDNLNMFREEIILARLEIEALQAPN